MLKIAIVLAQPFIPQQGGGSQTSALEMARALSAQGDDVTVVCELKRRKVSGILPGLTAIATRKAYARDRVKGITVWRVHDLKANFPGVLAELKPEVVLFQAMEALALARLAQDSGFPYIVYWRDAQPHRMGGGTEGLNGRYLANSDFTRNFYRELCQVESTTIYPLIEASRYRSLKPVRDAVVFIGLYPEKGGELAMQIAELCPDIPFLFVESWKLYPKLLHELTEKLKRTPNVKLVRHKSDMREIYGRARVVLAPSQWPEAWGRVASEAHVNGIPVLASRVGGLPEAVGPGGVLLEPDAPAAAWADALRRMWTDQQTWADLSQAALSYAAREQIQPSWQIARIREELKAAISAKKD